MSSAPPPALVEVLRRSTRYLADRGSASPRLDAELLIAHGLGLRRLDLYLQFDRPLDGAELVPLRELVRRRAAGEPVAYITGTREFWGRSFRVNPTVLIPRPETETLVERTLRWARSTAGEDGRGLRIADVATGSGCVACTLAAELSGATVLASDVSAEAAALAEENARRLGGDGRVRTLVGEWCAPLVEHAPLDALVANPPYVATAELATLPRDVRDFEPRLALDGGSDGLAAYRALLATAPAVLGAAGHLALEVDPRSAGAVRSLVSQTWPGAAVEVVADLAGRDRVVEASLDGG